MYETGCVTDHFSDFFWEDIERGSINLHLSNVTTASHLQRSEFKLHKLEKTLVLCLHPAPLLPSWQTKLDQHTNSPPKSFHCSGLVKNHILFIHPSSSGVNAFSTASSVAQCLHCNISGRDAIVHWKCKPWNGESRSAGAGALSLLVPSLQSPSWHTARAQGDVPDPQLWIMDMPAWTKVYPMQLASGRNLFCIYKQGLNSFNAVVESLLLL